MKLKLIAAVVGLALSAASHAAINSTGNAGGSDLLLDVWEQGATGGQADQSFTLDLGETFSQFVNTSSSSATLATLLSTDSTWQSFLSSSDLSSLQWSVIASGSHVVGTNAGIFGTAAAGTDPTTSGAFGFPTNSDLQNSNTQIATFIQNLNATGAAEQVGLKGSGIYYQDLHLSDYNGVSFSNSNAIGTDATVWSVNTIAKGTNTAAAVTELAGTMSFNQVGGNYVLSYNVAAVPEAPGFGMALAGLAALGFLAIRRRNA